MANAHLSGDGIGIPKNPTMTRAQAIEYICANPWPMLRPARKKGFVCPVCGSGTGKRGTGMDIAPRTSEIGHPRFICNACGAREGAAYHNRDALDLLRDSEHIGDFNALLRRACEVWGLPWPLARDGRRAPVRKGGRNGAAPGAGAFGSRPAAPSADQTDQSDYRAYLGRVAGEMARQLDILEGGRKGASPRLADFVAIRRLDPRLLRLYGIGYDAAWRHPSAPNAPASERIIIPIAPGAYKARALDIDAPHKKRYLQAGTRPPGTVFGGKIALSPRSYELSGGNQAAGRAVIATEGELNALAVTAAIGYEHERRDGADAWGLRCPAVAMGSTWDAAQLASWHGLHAKELAGAPWILVPDGDAAGRAAMETAARGLRDQGARVAVLGVCRDGEDPASVYVDDPGRLRGELCGAIAAAGGAAAWMQADKAIL